MRNNQPEALLVITRTGERAEITKDSFVIGKNKNADLTMEGNPAISRMHACIIFRDGVYRIKDMGSVNHTYVDDTRVESPMPLHNGAVIRLADEELVFYTDDAENAADSITPEGTEIVAREDMFLELADELYMKLGKAYFDKYGHDSANEFAAITEKIREING